jgi:hypothetical protein
MNKDLTNILAFFVGLFISAALILPGASYAAMSLTPVVPGYSSSAGTYRAPAGSFTMSAANAGFIQPAVATVGGKPITVPASLRMAANAGQFAKNAMRLNPYVIIGTLALPWLIEQGIEYIDGQWVKQDLSGGTYPGGVTWRNSHTQGATRSYDSGVYTNNCGATSVGCSIEAAAFYPVVYSVGYSYLSHTISCESNGICAYTAQRGSPYNSPTSSTVGTSPTANPAPSTYVPATDDDWDALPDPLPAIAPELPYAPYMPDGVPVDAPDYDFVPFSVPLGDPYTKPDSSTAQPMAEVSPNGDTVTVDTYDQPLTDANGDPVPDAQPQDTPEPAPDQCEKYPDSLGCLQMGTVDDSTLATQEKSIAAITPVSVGGVGSCPAPLTTSFMGQPVSFSYDLPCQAAGMLKPLVLALAWLSAGVIFIGGVRQ